MYSIPFPNLVRLRSAQEAVQYVEAVGKDPHLFHPLTQRALLAHGVLVFEGVVGKLRCMVRGRVAVAGCPFESDRAVS